LLSLGTLEGITKKKKKKKKKKKLTDNISDNNSNVGLAVDTNLKINGDINNLTKKKY